MEVRYGKKFDADIVCAALRELYRRTYGAEVEFSEEGGQTLGAQGDSG